MAGGMLSDALPRNADSQASMRGSFCIAFLQLVQHSASLDVA